MKAIIETVEPVIRPAGTKTYAPIARHKPRTSLFVPARGETVLFHAWRA